MEAIESLIGAFIIFFGLSIGSFLNVLIYRIPKKLSMVKGSSFCPSCGTNLIWSDLIPVLSFLVLGGKCRYCKESINFRYPFVELLNAASYLLIYLSFGLKPESFVYFIVASCLITLSMIDIDTKEIPDRFNIIIAASGVLAGVLNFGHLSWTSRLIGFFCISIPLFAIVLLTNGLGEGDVKLFAALGLLLGWRLILLTLLFASVSAAIFGIFMIIAKKANNKTQLAFGPFIAGSAYISLLYGENIIEWYINLLKI